MIRTRQIVRIAGVAVVAIATLLPSWAEPSGRVQAAPPPQADAPAASQFAAEEESQGGPTAGGALGNTAPPASRPPAAAEEPVNTTSAPTGAEVTAASVYISDEGEVRVSYKQADGKHRAFEFGGPTTPKQKALAEAVAHLANLPALRSLSLRPEEPLERADYRQIAELDRLDDVYIYTYARISGPELEPLKRMRRLESLEFQEARFGFEALKPLAKIPSLKVLRIPSAGDDWEAESRRRFGARFRIYATQNYAP